VTEAILQQVLGQIRVLDQYELRQVQRAVQERLAPPQRTQKCRAPAKVRVLPASLAREVVFTSPPSG